MKKNLSGKKQEKYSENVFAIHAPGYGLSKKRIDRKEESPQKTPPDQAIKTNTRSDPQKYVYSGKGHNARLAKNPEVDKKRNIPDRLPVNGAERKEESKIFRRTPDRRQHLQHKDGVGIHRDFAN
ncbi:MAG: hypothetical protein ACJ76H_04250 [Bacteriovoracaceae bacterium]